MQSLTNKEEQIMQAIWKAGHPCMISEILKTDPTLKRNTVAPSVVTLEAKGFLQATSIGKSVTRTGKAYSPLISEESYWGEKLLLSSKSKNGNARHRVLSYFSAFLQSDQIDQEFLDDIQSMIDDFKKSKKGDSTL